MSFKTGFLPELFVTYGVLANPSKPLLRKNAVHIRHLQPRIGPGKKEGLVELNYLKY